MISPFRLKAMSIHLLMSGLIIASIIALSLFIWFPYPFYEIDGTLDALLIIFCVDMVLGPCLTLIVSDNKKKVRELVADFTIILAVQIAALGYGIAEVYQQRISAIVYLQGSFHIVPVSDIPDGETSEILPTYRNVQYGMLRFVQFDGLNQEAIHAFMHSPSQFLTLEEADISAYNFPKDRVPSELYKRYGDGVYYRPIAGKNKDGVVVLSKAMEILEIGVVEQEPSEDVS